MPIRIPNALAFHRARNEMTQMEVAHALGLASAYVSQLETGAMLPSTEELRILCRLYSCKPEDMYAGRWLAALIDGKGTSR